MSPKRLTLIASVSLLLILISQMFLIYDYFNTTKESLVRESNAIVRDIFNKDLEIRRIKYKKIIGEQAVIAPPTPPPGKNGKYETVDATHAPGLKKDNIDMYLLTVNYVVSKYIPMQLSQIDSIAAKVLESRKIHSKYEIIIVDTKNNHNIAASGDTTGDYQFVVKSEDLIYDIFTCYGLRLQLINPFGEIFKRMGFMLLSSFIFSLICIWAFVYLQKILARQKQLVAFKNEFLSNIAHELKRPVASLTFNLDCLSLPQTITDVDHRDLLLRNSIRSTNEMNDAILKIVTLSKVEEGLLKLKSERINIVEMLEELRERFTGISAKTIDISIEKENDACWLTGDYDLLNAVFSNLIDNSIKYSGGTVQIQLRIKESVGNVAVSVKDNGNGIPAPQLIHVFEKYNRADAGHSAGGFGIGLNYVKTIVEEHRGKVSVTSELGQGSEFTVVLPTKES